MISCPHNRFYLPVFLMQPGEARQPDAHDQPDPASWVDEHGDYLFQYAVLRLCDTRVAEEIVRETLLCAIESLASYQGASTERTWLTSILRERIVDHYRESIRETPIGDNDRDVFAFDHLFTHPQWVDHWNDELIPLDWGAASEASLQQAEFYSALESCISKLPRRVAGVFLLREMEGYDGDEICRLLDLSANNLWTMMYRARMSLRTCIELNWFHRPVIH